MAKLKTFLDIVGQIRNWPDAVELRLRPKRNCLRLLEFRNGLNVVMRGGTREWSVVHELILVNGYGKALEWLKNRTEAFPVVLDLGGNIGLFSLLSARSHPKARILSFEPGVPNIRLFRMNMLANPELAERVQLHEYAVAGASGEATWNFHPDNPGGSSLYAKADDPRVQSMQVKLLAFTECLAMAPGDIALVKMDIEDAEWDILAKTPAAAWKQVQAIAMELHKDPTGNRSAEEFLDEMKALGFQVEREEICSYFLHR